MAVAMMVAGAMVAGDAAPADAYEFEVRARTLGQGYQTTRSLLNGSTISLDRRRFTQILSLNIWDIAGLGKDLKLHDSKLQRGPKIYFTSYMRIDNDFGNFTQGNQNLVSAQSLIPELTINEQRLDVLFGYVAIEDLAGGLIDIHIGRQLNVGTLDWWSMDGVTVRLDTPWMFAIEGFGGLRVRDSSPLGSYVQEPDGSAFADCEFFDEGLLRPDGGTGGWRRIDGFGTNPTGFCPQRDELMPTYGGAIETSGFGSLFARFSYRRAVSRSPFKIDSLNVDDNDRGFYPVDQGAPFWGVNEERMALTVRAPLRFAKGNGQVTPYLGARYSLLHGALDEAHLGARFRYGQHSVESELYYSFPTFDGDSIFNIFSINPFIDARLTYDLNLRGTPLRGYVRGWGRTYLIEDDTDKAMAFEEASAELAGGVLLGARYRLGRDRAARLDVFHEDGYGGRRTGSYISGAWRFSKQLTASTRLSVVDFAEDSRTNLNGTNFGIQLGGTYQIAKGIAVTLVGEENSNRFNRSQFRVIGMLDLAFNPEI